MYIIYYNIYLFIFHYVSRCFTGSDGLCRVERGVEMCCIRFEFHLAVRHDRQRQVQPRRGIRPRPHGAWGMAK